MKDQHCSLAQATFAALFVTAALVLNATAQAPPGSLWYNGDFNGVEGHVNGHNTSDPRDQVHDDFIVTSPGGIYRREEL